jgi:hypothetical protein
MYQGIGILFHKMEPRLADDAWNFSREQMPFMEVMAAARAHNKRLQMAQECWWGYNNPPVHF